MHIHLPLPPVPIQRCSSVYFTTYNEYEGYEVSLYYPILIKLFFFFFLSLLSCLSGWCMALLILLAGWTNCHPIIEKREMLSNTISIFILHKLQYSLSFLLNPSYFIP